MNSLEAARNVFAVIMGYLSLFQIVYSLTSPSKVDEFELNLSFKTPRIFLLFNGIATFFISIVLTQLDLSPSGHRRIKLVGERIS